MNSSTQHNGQYEKLFNLQLSAFISGTGILKNVKIITATDITNQLREILIGKAISL